MKTYTWGILGLGKIAAQFAQALNAVDNTRIICASRTVEKAKAFAERFNTYKYYGSYAELVKDSEVDVIYVATPMSCHYDDVMLCLENGKNVLCEKSVTLNASQWNELTEYATSKGLFLMEAMWMKFNPTFLTVKKWVNDGRIGDVVAVKADLCNRCVYDENDRLFVKNLGGGALLDLGVYVLTLACDFLGYSPDKVESAIRIGKSGADFNDAITLKYNNGNYADLASSFDYLSENKAYILGTNGSIVIGQWFHCARDAELFDENGKSVEVYDKEFICNGYEYEILHVMDCLERGLIQSDVQTHEKTLAIMKIMDGIRRDNEFVYEGFENN